MYIEIEREKEDMLYVIKNNINLCFNFKGLLCDVM